MAQDGDTITYTFSNGTAVSEDVSSIDQAFVEFCDGAGGATDAQTGGAGGRVEKAPIDVKSHNTLYIFVAGGSAKGRYSGGDQNATTRGGGSTEISLSPDDESDDTDLPFLVAAGGGGGSFFTDSLNTNAGGDGGAREGEAGTSSGVDGAGGAGVAPPLGGRGGSESGLKPEDGDGSLDDQSRGLVSGGTIIKGGGSGPDTDGEIQISYKSEFPARPTNLIVTDATTEDELTLNWTEAPDATGYRVLRAESSGSIKSDYTEIADVPAPPFTDTRREDGEEYYYRVVSRNEITEGLVGWYRFADSSQTAIDSTAALGVGSDQTAFDGTVNGASYLSSGGVRDAVDGTDPSGAYQFDGIDDVIDVGDDIFDFSSNQPFTVAFWCNKKSTNGNNRFLGRDTDNPNYGFLVDNFFKNDEGVVFRADGNEFSLGTASTVINQYFHGAVVNKGNATQEGYVNGNNTVTGGLTWGNGRTLSFQIGGAELEQNLACTLDDVRIYNRALSSSEIQSIYNNTEP
jgi:hypothetical protein